MDAKELRIGNWVMFSNKIEPDRCIQVNARFFSSLAGGRNIDEVINDTELNGHYKPIPLTPEILEKAGFVYRRNFNDYAIPFKSMMFAIAKSIFDETGTWYLCDYKANHSVEFQYVHHLQNLFWIITGTDLPLTFN